MKKPKLKKKKIALRNRKLVAPPTIPHKAKNKYNRKDNTLIDARDLCA